MYVSIHCWKVCKTALPFWKTYGNFLLNLRNISTTAQQPTFRFLSKRNEKVQSHEGLQKDAHMSLSQEVEKDGPAGVYTYGDSTTSSQGQGPDKGSGQRPKRQDSRFLDSLCLEDPFCPCAWQNLIPRWNCWVTGWHLTLENYVALHNTELLHIPISHI